MRRIAIFTLLLLSLNAASQDAPQLPSAELPPELARVLRDYEKAWHARDEAALADLFAEDGFVMASSKPPVRGRDEIRKAYANSGGPLALRSLAYAIEGSVGYIIGAFGGSADGPDDGKFILALKKDKKGQWLIAADIDNGNRRRNPPATP
jgi:ketosteroid isomerase-like protein